MNSTICTEQQFAGHALTGNTISECRFINCDFSRADLTETVFKNCHFYDDESQTGCDFAHSVLKEARFIGCDLSLCNFRYADAFGIEIKECRAQGADFRSASFMNKITERVWFCSAFIIKSNLSYTNFSKAVLEKCELWENRWTASNVLGASFIGSDLSGGEFNEFDWRSANFTFCDLTGAELGNLNIRDTELDGVKLDMNQAGQLLMDLGIILQD